MDTDRHGCADALKTVKGAHARQWRGARGCQEGGPEVLARLQTRWRMGRPDSITKLARVLSGAPGLVTKGTVR